jgi:hypothetical protein
MLFPRRSSWSVGAPQELFLPREIPSRLEERENHGVEYDVKSSISDVNITGELFVR